MPVTTTFNGVNVTTAESLTSWSAYKISGTGGGPSADTADGQIQGSGAVTAVASRQRIALYYDIGQFSALDFSVGGTEEGDMLFIWGNFLAAALLNAQSAGGFGVFLGTAATTNYALYYFYGSDNYAGGWRRFIIDPTVTPSSTAGTFDVSSVRYIGLFADVGSSVAKFDNLIVDRIDHGKGLTVTGVSTADDLLGDVLSDDEGTSGNRYGVLKSLNDSKTALELAGQLTLGDNTGTAVTTLTDVDKKIFLAEPTYYNGTSVQPSVPVDFFSINVVGNATGATSVTLGKKVGIDNGRNGWSVIGNPTYDLNIDFDDGNVNTLGIYGTSFETITGTIALSTNTAFEFMGNVWNNCTQVPVGAVEIRNETFVNYGGTDGAILWNASADIQGSQFINNDFAVEHPAAITTTYVDLLFSGNTTDIHYTQGSGTLTLNVTGSSNPSTSTATGTGTVVINNTIAWTLEIVDQDGNAVQDAEVTVTDGAASPTEFYSLENTPASGLAVYSFDGVDSGSDVTILAIKSGTQAKEPFSLDTVHPNNDTTTTIQLTDDRTESNP